LGQQLQKIIEWLRLQHRRRVSEGEPLRVCLYLRHRKWKRYDRPVQLKPERAPRYTTDERWLTNSSKYVWNRSLDCDLEFMEHQ
jgi:hypothetical protein